MRCSILSALGLGALLLSLAQSVSADPVQFQSGATQTSLLELYTSEGCSSCPPAEAWLSRLKKSPQLWKDVVPVAFHVDYWDYLGWKDPFAAKAYTQRQHDYAAHWHNGSVYTPGFVRDGLEWRGWLESDELPRASKSPAGTLSARSEDGKQWILQFRSPAATTSTPWDFHAALLGFALSSDVKAGENRGRKLQHDFVVLALANGRLSQNGDSFQGELSLTSILPFAPKRFGFAAWVTSSKSLQPLQAVGGWLPTAKPMP